MVKVLATLLATAAVGSHVHEQSHPHSETTDDPWQRAAKLVAQMNLTEKLQFVQGDAKDNKQGYVGFIPGVPRLGIPDLNMNDGPQGSLFAVVVFLG